MMLAGDALALISGEVAALLKCNNEELSSQRWLELKDIV